MNETLTATAERLARALARSETGTEDDMGAWYALIDAEGAGFFGRVMAAEDAHEKATEAHRMELARLRSEHFREAEALRAELAGLKEARAKEVKGFTAAIDEAREVAMAAAEKAKEVMVVLEMVLIAHGAYGKTVAEIIPKPLRTVAEATSRNIYRTATPQLINRIAMMLNCQATEIAVATVPRP